jgi:hypothetical protein
MLSRKCFSDWPRNLPLPERETDPEIRVDRHKNWMKSVKPLWKAERLGITLFVFYFCVCSA